MLLSLPPHYSTLDATLVYGLPLHLSSHSSPSRNLLQRQGYSTHCTRCTVRHHRQDHPRPFLRARYDIDETTLFSAPDLFTDEEDEFLALLRELVERS